MRIAKLDEVQAGIGWSELTLQYGIPVNYRDEKYMLLTLFMARSAKGDIKRASKSPLVKNKDDDAVATLTLANCVVGTSDRLYTVEQADAHLLALDNDDKEAQDEILSNPVQTGLASELIYILPANLDDDEILIGDIEAITDAFKMVNRIGQREMGSFFKISRN